MSGKKRTTVSLEQGIIDKARTMMKEEDFGDFSGFIEQVIRERWIQHNPAAAMHEAAPTSYQKGRTKKLREP